MRYFPAREQKTEAATPGGQGLRVVGTEPLPPYTPSARSHLVLTAPPAGPQTTIRWARRHLHGEAGLLPSLGPGGWESPLQTQLQSWWTSQRSQRGEPAAALRTERELIAGHWLHRVPATANATHVDVEESLGSGARGH